ncbi:uncharacterized protein LOC116049976 [Sander lucioperca]|uniref:uncharacterized protein LOC116049976 n=1 Tax=Sander lucioperca TaxID=283035 RepID=UPI00165379E2|nr:uncharacterized protein LOC116049976 [Sander lucioperca]
MSLWQVVGANRVSLAGLGYRVYRVPGVSTRYGVADVDADVDADSRSFCLSREKLNMQQLNQRLASYLQQVQCLEAANQRLEQEIQEELDRKCPRERRQLDGHLRTVSLLQELLSEALSAQAQVKLQLLGAELTIHDFNVRCEKQREQRGRVEAELSNLRCLDEDLKIQTLPELQSLISDQEQHLVQLQIQHQQDTQGLLAQTSVGVDVAMQSAESSDLIRKLDVLRQTSGNHFLFNTQVSMLSSPEATFDPAAESELAERRRTAASLEEELTHMQALNMALEASGREQTESFTQQLVVLQQRADSLCRDLDSALQTTTQQAADNQILLDVKSRLEAEILDYRRLLDGLSLQRVSSLQSDSFCATTSPSAFRRNITANKTISVQGRNFSMVGVQTFPQGHIGPVVAPLSETVTTVQPINVQSKHSNNPTVKPINTSNLTDSFHKSENQRMGVLSEKTGRECMTISVTIDNQSSPVEAKVHTRDCDLQNSNVSLDEGPVAKASKSEINTAQAIKTLVPNTQSAKSTIVQAKSEHFTSKQTTTEAGLQASKTGTNIQTEITKNILTAEPEAKEGSHHVPHTMTTDPRKQTAAEVKKETETVILAQMNCNEGYIQAKNQDPAQVVSLSLKTPAETDGDKGEVAVTASVVSGSQIHKSEGAQGKVLGKEAVVKPSNLQVNIAEGTTTLVPDTQSARSTSVQAKPESFTSTQTTAEASFQATKTGTHIQTEITKTRLCAEPEVKQESHFATNTTTTDPSEKNAAEVKKETTTVISTQMDCTEGYIQAKNQDPAQVVSLSLKTPAETDGDKREVAVTASVVYGSHLLRSEEAQVNVSGELTLIHDMDIEREERKGEEVVGTLSNASNIGTNKVMKDADLGSGIGTDSHSSPESNGNLESTEILEKVEVEMNKGKAIDGFHDTNEVKVDPAEMDNEIVNPAGQEALLSTTKSKSLTETGMTLSSSDHEMIQSPSEVHTFVIPTKPLTCSSPETCLSPDDTEVLMSMADQVFFPLDPEEHVISPGSIYPPNDPAMFLSPNESDTCFSPVNAKGCLSPNGEEDEEVCLNLTEANANVRQLEKYILSTKEEGQSLSSSRDQALQEVDINRKVSISVRDGNSLCIGSLEGNEGRSDTIINSGPTSRGIGLQLCSGLGVQNLGLGGKYGSEEQKETSSIDCEVRGNKNSDRMVANKPGNSERVFVKSASFGSVPANGGTTLSSMASDLGASFGGTAANSSGTVSCNAEATTAGEQGIFRRGSGDWMVYSSGLGRTSRILPSTGSQESLSGATSRPETGRFGRRGSGEGVVYGGSIGIESSLEGAASLPSKGKEEGTSVATNSLTSPQETGRFGSRGGGEWMVYGGSLGQKSSLSRTGSEESQSVNVLPAASPSAKRRFGSGEWMIYSGSFKCSDSLPNAESRESQSMTTQVPTSPPETRRFGSRGSGEWRVYGGSTGRMSRAAGSDNLFKAGSEESLLATSQPGALRARRFGSEDSGEWRVYGGSTGSLSSASNADRVSKYSQVISPPSSYTSSGQRLSSAGSDGRLSSGGVVRRSSSLGSGGRLSSSGSGSKLSSSSRNQRTGSSSGRFASTGSGESKPVYSSVSGRRSSGGGTTSRQRAPSPGGRINVGNGGWQSSSPAGGSRVSSTGSGSKLSNAGSGDLISSRAGGGRISSSGSGRTNSTGGRVISSSDRPIRSTGSGAGGNKERISVCKMAALSISAAGRQRSQDQQRQQQAAATSPRVQRWLTTGVSVTSAEPDGLDDIMRL